MGLGGIYSTLANKLQKPLVLRYLKRLKAKGVIQDDLINSVDLDVITGSAALGRGTEFRSLQAFVSVVGNTIPDALSYIKVDEFMKRVATSLDINTGSLVKTQEEIQAEQEAQLQRDMAVQQAGPMVQAQVQKQQEG